MLSSKFQNILDYTLVFLLTCFSGNPLFVSVNETPMYYIYFALFALIVSIRSGKIIFSSFIKYMWLYFLLYLTQLVLLPDASISSIGFMVIKTYIGCSVFLHVGKRFTEIFIKIMAVVCFVGLFFYLYTQRFGLLPGVPTSDHTISIGVFTQLYSLDDQFINRNSGMFWEPGAFQAYINIAIAFMMLKQKFSKLDWTVFVLFVISIITTYSTTGFILLGMNIVYYVTFKAHLSRFWKMVAIIVTVGACAYYFVTLDFMQEKILAHTDLDLNTESRINDLRRFSSVFLDNMLIGVSYIEIWSGNGFMINLLHVGILGAVYYYASFYRNLKRYQKGFFPIFFFSIILVSLQGEVLLMYPFYLSLPFLIIKNTSEYENDCKTNSYAVKVF